MKKLCYIAGIALATGGTLWAQTNATTNATVSTTADATAASTVNAATNTTTNTTAAVNANTNAVSQILALVTTNPPPAKPQLRGPTRIESDSVDFDLAKREAVYRGHVRVDDPEMKLTGEWLVADLPQTGNRINHIVAETNVVIDAADDKGQRMHATAAKAVYVYDVTDGVTNETVTLTGNAKIETARGWLTGEPIIWNRATGILTASKVQSGYEDLNGTTVDTNSTTRTNSVLTGNDSLMAETNPPPPVATNLPAVDTNFPPGKPDLIPSKTSKPESK